MAKRKDDTEPEKDKDGKRKKVPSAVRPALPERTSSADDASDRSSRPALP